MKKLISNALFAVFLGLVISLTTGSKAHAQDVMVSYQTFYDELSPYGEWIYDPEYGNVWVPNESGDFRPYGSRGRWAMTEYGNTWVSDDPWGWAVYHYGRWTFNPYYGWVWVPGYEWAPAWVSWRYGGGYCGWAPLSPGYGVGITYGCPDSWWIFVGPQYVYNGGYYNYWRGPSYNHQYIRHTTIINNVYTDNYTHVRYNYGPRRSTIENVTHQPVQVYRVSQATRPGASAVQQNTLHIYRPGINQSTVGTARPSNVMQAPRSIGRPQAATEIHATRQPAFRQDVVRQNTGNNNTGVVGPRNNARPGDSRSGVQPQSQPPVRGGQFDSRQSNPTERSPQSQPPVRNAPQYDTRQDRNPQSQPPVRNNPQVDGRQENQDRRGEQNNRPQPQRFQPQDRSQPEPQNNRSNQQPERQQPSRFDQQQQQTRPEPPRYNPPAQQQQTRPEPPRYNPPAQQQQTRPEPPRNNPPPQQQQTRPEPPRSNPQPQSQPAPPSPRQQPNADPRRR